MYWFPPALLFSVIPFAITSNAFSQEVLIKAGVPLHIVLDERTSFTKVGQPLRGHLSQPVYVVDRVALPAGTVVLGKVADVHPVAKRKRINAISTGDFTPLREPQVQFNTLILQDGTELPISSNGAERDSAVVHMSSSTDQKGLWKQLKGSVKDTVSNEKRSVDEAIHRPNKLQWAKNSLLARLPYHPQVFDAGTQFVAELQSSVAVHFTSSAAVDTAPLGTKLPPDSILHARLNSELNSSANHWGDHVDATLTEPLLNSERKLLLPEGTHLVGSITRSEPAKRFGRNGQLSFTFKEIELPNGFKQSVRGQLSAADSTSRVRIDEEGNTRATEPKAKYLVPLAVVLLSQAGAENDNDGLNGGQSGSVNSGVAGGGFGLTGRLLALTAGSRGLAYGLGYYGASRSIYSRFIARGHDVVFPKDTQIEIKIGSR
jgi:hypothetical protein